MSARRKPEPLLHGTATHRRTQSDYMGALLDTVTLDAWRDVVARTLTAAKAGDAQARTWLAHYLIGRPTGEAPTPLTVIVQQLSGNDPLVAKLAKPAIDRFKYPALYDNEDEDAIREQIAEELPTRIAGES